MRPRQARDSQSDRDRRGQRARVSNRGRRHAGNEPKYVTSGVRAPIRECMSGNSRMHSFFTDRRLGHVTLGEPRLHWNGLPMSRDAPAESNPNDLEDVYSRRLSECQAVFNRSRAA